MTRTIEIPMMSVTNPGSTKPIPATHNRMRLGRASGLVKYPMKPAAKAVIPMTAVIVQRAISNALPIKSIAGFIINIKGTKKAPMLNSMEIIAVLIQLDCAREEAINTVPQTGGVRPAKME